MTVLNDGSLPIETKLFTGSPEGAAKLLEGRFLSKEATPTAVNEWLVNTGDKLILVDTGTSNLFGPGLGRGVGIHSQHGQRRSGGQPATHEVCVCRSL